MAGHVRGGGKAGVVFRKWGQNRYSFGRSVWSLSQPKIVRQAGNLVTATVTDGMLLIMDNL